MLDLFRMEVEAQAAILNDNLLVLETNPSGATELESLMRAAHSIKGATRIVSLDAAVKVAHVMEDCFVAAQNGAIAINSAMHIDILLQGVDMLIRISKIPENELKTWPIAHQAEIENLVVAISAILTPRDVIASVPVKEIEHPAIFATLYPEETPPPDNEPQDGDRCMLPLREGDLSMLALFRTEVATQATLLNQILLELKTNSDANLELESLIQAAHLIKGAAKIVQLEKVVKIARALEDCFLNAQKIKIILKPAQIDNLLPAIALLLRLVQIPETEAEKWLGEHNT